MDFKKIISAIVLGFSLYVNIALAEKSVISERNIPIVNEMLAQMFNTTLDDVTIETLQGGFSGDELYLITCDNTKIVVRTHKNDKNPKKKQLEYKASKNASDLGIGPKILYVSKDYNLIVTEFIEAKHPNFKSFMKEDQINNLVESLLKLHNGPDLPDRWSVFEYIRRITPKYPNEKEKLAIAELGKIENSFQRSAFKNRPCHNDIQKNNLFVVDDKVLFIDWGDAGMSDPFWDLARSSMEFAFSSKQDNHLLAKYFGKVTNLEKSRFFIMKQVFLLRSAFWLKDILGKPDEETLNNIIKIFDANDYPINIDDQEITWHYIYIHAMDLFLKNSKTNLYQESLKSLNQES